MHACMHFLLATYIVHAYTRMWYIATVHVYGVNDIVQSIVSIYKSPFHSISYTSEFNVVTQSIDKNICS